MKRIALFALFVLFFGITATGYAQGPDRVTDPAWQARYWNNLDMSGNPVVTRFESDPAYRDVTGGFADGVSADGFSARFEKYIDVAAGTYRFNVTADDGVRVSVDGNLIINQWKDQANASYSADVVLTRGYHYVVVDYYDRAQLATLQLQWGPATTPPPPTSGPWTAQYWNNKTLTGNPAVTATVNEINFDFGAGSPAAGVNANEFSARWVRTVDFQAGTYRFTATADDGMRVFVAGRAVIDQWKMQAATTYTYDIYIPGGNTEVKVEYFDDKGNAVAKVRWERVGNTTPPPSGTPTAGEVIVEDTSAGFVKGGSPNSWRTAAEGSGNSLTWTRNNDVERPNYNYARWYPSLRANTKYEVFVYIPERYTTTTAAKYYIAHRDGVNSVVVNQSTNGNRWVSLGTYTFQGTNADYVSLNDITGERRLTSLIAYDAVKFVPR